MAVSGKSLANIARIFILNLLMFIITICIFGFTNTTENPMLGPGALALVKMGARYNWDIIKKYHVKTMTINRSTDCLYR